MKELMYDIPAGVIAVIVLVVALVAMELAYRWGRRFASSASDDTKGHISTVQTSTLGILALLLAFTFSLSLQRFETRSDAVVDEANAIGTAYLRALLLPVAHRADVRRLLRDYVDLRVRAGAVATNEEERLGELVGQAARLQEALWEHARRSAEADPNWVTSGLFIQALNDMIDSLGRRDAAINRHVPEAVLFLLLGTFVMTVAIVGFGTGAVGQRPSWVSVAMVVLIVGLVVVILDLDRPRRGLIEVSEKNLLDLQGSMRNEVAAAARPSASASGAVTAGGPQR